MRGALARLEVLSAVGHLPTAWRWPTEPISTLRG